MNQTSAILKYITEHGSITAREAMTELGVYRLAARIADLKHIGIPITRRMEHGKNRDGATCKWCRYYLEVNDGGS